MVFPFCFYSCCRQSLFYSNLPLPGGMWGNVLCSLLNTTRYFHVSHKHIWIQDWHTPLYRLSWALPILSHSHVMKSNLNSPQLGTSAVAAKIWKLLHCLWKSRALCYGLQAGNLVHTKNSHPPTETFWQIPFTLHKYVILGASSRHGMSQLTEAILFWWELNSVLSPLYQTPQSIFMTTGCWQMCSV